MKRTLWNYRHIYYSMKTHAVSRLSRGLARARRSLVVIVVVFIVVEIVVVVRGVLGDDGGVGGRGERGELGVRQRLATRRQPKA